MRKVIFASLIILSLVSVSLAKVFPFAEKEIIEIIKDGEVRKDAPFRQLNFKVVKDKIYVEGVITRDTLSESKGETFSWKDPFVIVSRGLTLPVEPPIWSFAYWRKIFYKDIERSQKVLCAVKMTGALYTVPETLILGENFYMMSRPGIAGLDYITISRGERVINEKDPLGLLEE